MHGVRRSNQGLNYLAPIRTSQSDAADDGRKGVTPLANVPGSGKGWTGSQIANEAINSEKIAPGGVTSGDLADNAVTTAKIGAAAVTGAKLAAGAVGTSNLSSEVQGGLNTIYTATVFNTPGQEPTLTFGKGATSVVRAATLPVGAFDVAFTNSVAQCSLVASIGTAGRAGAVVPVFGHFGTYTTLLNDTTLRIFTFNDAKGANGEGPLADAPFSVQAVC